MEARRNPGRSQEGRGSRIPQRRLSYSPKQDLQEIFQIQTLIEGLVQSGFWKIELPSFLKWSEKAK